jgi:hypothetical protein
MSGASGTIGEHWADAWDVSPPSADDVARAHQSTTARREVDLHYARWLGLPEDQVGPFLERLSLSGLRARAFEERVAKETAAHERLDADLAAFWSKHGQPASQEAPASAYGAAALRRELAAIEGSPKSRRTGHIRRAAYGLGRLVAGGELPAQGTRGALLEVAAAVGVGEEVAATVVAGGLAAGAKRPRIAPEMRA